MLLNKKSEWRKNLCTSYITTHRHQTCVTCLVWQGRLEEFLLKQHCWKHTFASCSNWLEHFCYTRVHHSAAPTSALGSCCCTLPPQTALYLKNPDLSQQAHRETDTALNLVHTLASAALQSQVRGWTGQGVGAKTCCACCVLARCKCPL